MNGEAQTRSDAEWRARALSCPECAARPFAECSVFEAGARLLGVHPARIVEVLTRAAEAEARLLSRRDARDPRLRAAAGRAQLTAARHGIAAVVASSGGVS